MVQKTFNALIVDIVVGLRMNRLVSWAMVFTLLMNVFALAFFVQSVRATGTIYIRADGTIDPQTAPISTADNVTYTFTDNTVESVVVERNNIVIDGNGYTLQGSGSGNGIYLSGRENVTVRNTQVKGFFYGIVLTSSSNYNTISGNSVTANSGYGIRLYSDCNYNGVYGNNITDNGVGILLHYASSNSISGNNITANSGNGIMLGWSHYNSIFGNTVAANSGNGINFYAGGSYNSIVLNNITQNSGYGLYLWEVTDLYAYQNNFIDNYGIFLQWSQNNYIYHNNFINNPHKDFTIEYSWNVLDDGYPSGGNYWSDYFGEDLYCGPYQDIAGSDGIGDTPYTFNADNQDNYPLMKPYPWNEHDLGITLLSPSKDSVAQGYNVSINVMVFNYGSYDESFNITLQANGDLIGKFHGVNIASRNSVIATFNWSSSSYERGNYGIGHFRQHLHNLRLDNDLRRHQRRQRSRP
jgi:parallel beta-helix repeat protein